MNFILWPMTLFLMQESIWMQVIKSIVTESSWSIKITDVIVKYTFFHVQDTLYTFILHAYSFRSSYIFLFSYLDVPTWMWALSWLRLFVKNRHKFMQKLTSYFETEKYSFCSAEYVLIIYGSWCVQVYIPTTFYFSFLKT